VGEGGTNLNSTEDNPVGNRLGPSVTEESLIKAIVSSGYPLQGVVAHKLKEDFHVTEEWGYIDRDEWPWLRLNQLYALEWAACSSLLERKLYIRCKNSIGYRGRTHIYRNR